MRRITITEIMRETGLSRATVDRVINERGQVHARTRTIIEDTIRRLQLTNKTEVLGPPVADFALRAGKGMISQMRAAWARAGVQGTLDEMHMASDDQVLRRIEILCRDASRPLILTAKSNDRLVAVLRAARKRGKRIIAAVSDLPPDARDAFVGIDDRAAGQTAAFLIGRTLGDRPTTVGVVLGNIAFRCHEDREIGFRTGLRAHFPKVILAAEAQAEDSGAMTRDAVLKMVRAQPALGAIYNVGGGNAGLVEALRMLNRDDILLVAHEVNTVTTPLLRSGGMDFAVAGSPSEILTTALELARQPVIGQDRVLRDFGVYTRFNIPDFGLNA